MLILTSAAVDAESAAVDAEKRKDVLNGSEGFQRAEFLLEHGFVDKIVERKKLRKVLVTIIRSCEYEQ